MKSLQTRTGAWYRDRELQLSFPDKWDVTAHWPNTPEPLTAEEIERRIDAPVDCEPIAELARDAATVSIVVDDLSRPTPAHRVLPMLIRRLRSASANVRIHLLVATGTHGDQDEVALRNKIGADACESCEVQVHSDLKAVRKIGVTSFDTPVFVNETILTSDLVIGVGGVYPQHTTGFGGGGKLALGICGRQTIMELHYKHKSMEGRYNTDNDFRRDVCEIASMIGLNAILTLHIDGHSQIVNAVFGHHESFYDDAARFSHDRYVAPAASDADVVIANAYPLDTSLTFMRKGYKPLYTAPADMVKVMIAAAPEGVGVHGLFQYINPSRIARIRNLAIRAWSMDKVELAKKVRNRVVERFKPPPEEDEPEEETTILPPNTEHLYLYRTEPSGQPLPELDRVTVTSDWAELLRIIEEEHFPDATRIRAIVYPCAPIQCIDDENDGD